MSIGNLSQQIFQTKFDMRTGGASISGFPVSIRIKNQSLSFEPVFWGSELDPSLGGLKRSNIRGYNLTINLDYDVSLEPTKVRTIFNSLTNLKSNQYELRFYPDASGTDYVDMIPTGNVSYKIQYNNTVRVGGSTGVTPQLELTSRRYRDSVNAFFQT